MRTTFQRPLSLLVSGSVVGLVAIALIATPAFGQATEPKGEKAAPKSDEKSKDARDSAKNSNKDSKDAAKDARDSAKDTAKDTSKGAKDSAKDTRDTAKESAKDARDSAKDTSKAGKDSAKDAREAAKDTAKDSRDSARDAAKDTRDSARDSARDTRDSARDARDSTRDSARDTRDAARDTRDSARDSDRDRDTARDTRDTRDTRDSRDVTRDSRDARDTRDSRDVTRDTRDSRDLRDTRDSRDRDITRDSRDTRDLRDTRTTRDSRSTSRSQIENFRADSVTAADLGLRFGRASDRGLVINTIESNAVFADLGFRRDDVIISVADQRVRSEQDFVRLLFAPDYRDERITVIVLRDDREVPIYVRPARLVEQIVLVQDDYDPLHEFGLVIDDSRDTIVVQRVIRESPAFRAGIREGDVITTFRGERVRSPREFVRLVERVEPGAVPIEVTRNRQVEQFNVDLPRRAARRPVAAPEVDVNRATPSAERREERREIRTDRRDDRRGGPPATQPSNSQPARPGLLPRNR